jgi:riboflavin transporter
MPILRLKKMVYIVSLAAVSIILALLEIPWFLPTGVFSGFLMLDFSEVAILVALFVLGYKETVVVIVLRSLVRVIFKGFEPVNMIGEVIAMGASFSIMHGYLIARKILKKQDLPLFYSVSIDNTPVNWKSRMTYITSISLSLSIWMLALNFFITTPFLLSIYGLFGSSGQLHFTVFSFVQDSNLFNLSSFFLATFLSYTPFNLVKGISVTMLFLILMPRLKYLEL